MVQTEGGMAKILRSLCVQLPTLLKVQNLPLIYMYMVSTLTIRGESILTVLYLVISISLFFFLLMRSVTGVLLLVGC